MDIAVLSDIHGNYVALARCLEYAFSRNISTFLFLGDYIGELSYPEKTMQILYDLNEKYKCYFIKGNKEDYWLKYRAGGEKGWKVKILAVEHYYMHTIHLQLEIWIFLHS